MAIARHLPRSPPRKRAVHIARPPRASRNLLTMRKCQKSMRALAEKSVAQTRELYVHSLEAVLEGWERFVVAAGQGTLALNRKAIDITRRNINNGFGLAERLAGAKNLAEAMELQTTYWRKQVGELASQAGEMRTLSTKVTANVTAPTRRR